MTITHLETVSKQIGNKITLLHMNGGYPSAIKCTLQNCILKDYAGEKDILFITYRPVKKRKDQTISVRDNTSIAVFSGHIEINDGPAETYENGTGLIVQSYGLCFDPANFTRALKSTSQQPLFLQEREA